MAHEIEGNKAFFVGTPAWHDIGTVLTDAPTIEQAWNMAYPHTLLKVDLEATIKTDDGEVIRMPLQNSKVIMRDDGKEFKTVGADFELVQPIEVLNYFRPLLESGLVDLEAGGSLRGGTQMWALGKVKSADADIVPGDHVKGYVLMFTGFDGSLRIGTSQTNTRVVCANTLAIAIGSKAERAEYKFKHTKNVRERMENATGMIKQALENFRNAADQYRALANKQVTEPRLISYVKNVFLTEEERSDADKVSTKKSNIVQNVIDLLDTQRGLELVPAIRGTAWQGYNAVTEYLTHDYGRSADTRVQSAWFGENHALNVKALELAHTM